jgi:hypothetical protein
LVVLARGVFSIGKCWPRGDRGGRSPLKRKALGGTDRRQRQRVDHIWLDKLLEISKITLPPVVAVLGTLGATLIAHRHVKHQARAAKALDFTERRVREFYSPMVGSIKRIRALSELRVEMSSAANAAWHQICERSPKRFLEHEKAFRPFKAIIDYENEQLYTEILPAYDRMVAIFTEHYWLADPETQEHYGPLCRFVEIWHRHKVTAIPFEVLVELNGKEWGQRSTIDYGPESL